MFKIIPSVPFFPEKFRPWFFVLISIYFAMTVPSGWAHDVDMPPWVKESATCSIDVHSNSGFAEIEFSLKRSDAVRLSGDKFWMGKETRDRVGKLLKNSVFFNGQAPASVLNLEASPRFERWNLQWTGSAPATFELSTTFFKELKVPAWCRVFMFPRYGDPERSFFFLSDKLFRWPEAENPAPSPSETSVWGRFLLLGYRHILPEGFDHILFVLGLCLAARGLDSLVGQITAFTLAHTLSLGLAARGIVGLHSGVVEPLIALSIVLVALENLFRKEPPRWRWAVVFGFGLVHGLGFAGALRETGLFSEAFLQSLLAFNLGVEGGQLTVVGLALAILWPLRQKKWFRKRVLVPVCWCIAAVGFLWAVQRIL